VSFPVMINSYIGIFDLNRIVLPCRKKKKCGKIRRLVDSGIVKTCDELDLYEHEMLPICICPLCECLHP
jgi:hypothetical protein